MGISVYQASVEGFYRKLDLSKNNYQGEVKLIGKERCGLGYWLKWKKKGIGERLSCGESLLDRGEIRRGVYEVIKGLRLEREEIKRGRCNKDEWERWENQMKKVLKRVPEEIKGVMMREWGLVKQQRRISCQ